VHVTGAAIGSAQIPKTATPWYNLLILGVALALAGVLGSWRLSGNARKAGSSRRMPLTRWASVAAIALGIGCLGFALVGIAHPIDSLAGYPGTSSSGSATSANGSTASTNGSAANLAVLTHPKVGNKLGVLSIPSLGQKFPIVEGTSATELQRGIGHFRGSVMPGGKDNCVLSGHRDTVFAKLGRLRKGDQLVVTTAAGKFTYKITQIRIVHADNKTVVVHDDHAVLTVTTCYPFRFVGSAPDRFVLVCSRPWTAAGNPGGDPGPDRAGHHRHG
jgi:sortase A